MQRYGRTQALADVPFFKVMDNALIPNDCMVFNAEKLVFQLGEEPLPEIKICAQANAQHFHKLVVLMDYLDQTLAQNQQLNKRSVYYSLLSTFPQGQQDLDDRIFEVCQILGGVPRRYFGIQATCKGMVTGRVLQQFTTP